LSLNDATMLVVASVIGSGIFFTPGRVADLVPHAGIVLAAWFLGGLLSLAGAFANAELGAMYPRAGGDYVYLREAFHPGAGFLVGWLTFFAIFSGTVATLAVALAGGLSVFVPLGETGTVLVAIAFVALTSAINYIALRWGARLNNLTSYLKIAALLAFCVAGPLLGRGSIANSQTGSVPVGTISLAAFGLALSPILFTYLGWNAPVYVASEIRNPGRNVPRSLFLGLAICVGIYLLMNAVYLYAIPLESLRGELNVGEAAARALFGPVAGTVVALFVLVSVLGTLNATILVGPRIAYAMALDGLFFGGTDRIHADYRTPHHVSQRARLHGLRDRTGRHGRYAGALRPARAPAAAAPALPRLGLSPGSGALPRRERGNRARDAARATPRVPDRTALPGARTPLLLPLHPQPRAGTLLNVHG
jgi:APA family basic amino acid/polyamine antiporter